MTEMMIMAGKEKKEIAEFIFGKSELKILCVAAELHSSFRLAVFSEI